MKRSSICLITCMAALALTGCGNGRMSETRSWMQDEKSKGASIGQTSA